MSIWGNKNLFVKILGFGAAIIATVSGFGFLFTGKQIPGLSSFALALLCGVFVYQIRKTSKHHEKRIAYMSFIIACIFNILAGVLQIISYTRG